MSKVMNRCISLSFNVILLMAISIVTLLVGTNWAFNVGILGFTIGSGLIYWDLYDIEKMFANSGVSE